MRIIAAGILIALSAEASAQEFTPPRFEGLEQQQLNHEQRQFDQLEEARQREQIRSMLPRPGQSPAHARLRDLELRDEAARLQLDALQRRSAIAREAEIRRATLPNRRIAAHSSLVVTEPERFALPAAPRGQYYARLEGRFVLVDATSEMVVEVLEPVPSDPTGDLPPQIPPNVITPPALPKSPDVLPWN